MTDGKEHPITLLGDTQVFTSYFASIRGFDAPRPGYVVTVVATASCLLVALFAAGQGVGSIPAVVGLALVAAYGERGRITLRGNLTVSISLLPAIFAAVLFGPLAAMIVFGASAVGLSFPIVGRVTYGASRALTGALAAGAVIGRHVVDERRHWRNCRCGDNRRSGRRTRRRWLCLSHLLAAWSWSMERSGA